MISKIAQTIGRFALGLAIFVILAWLWVAVPGIVFGAIILVTLAIASRFRRG